ncbi:MAG: 2-amino-4-oxopentanoate thiolase subunit OrtA [Anaerovoracaceae bacterium]|jgi:hypothetical protein
MSAAKKGDWVQVQEVVLKAGHRAPQVPEDTQKCDLKMWVKGIADSDGELGDEIEITTVTGRKTKGTLVEVNPRYIHDYGNFQPELLQIEMQLKEIMSGGDK